MKFPYTESVMFQVCFVGEQVSGAGEAGANSVSANYLCIAAETHLYVTACKTPVQGAMPYKEIQLTSLYEM